MRIVAIRGSNLASLKGDFAVELDQPPLSNLGLFAIHGPVGAGKSTLLDALTLALFGRTPRLSGSGGAVLVRGDDDVDQLRANDPATLVRRGASSAHAEVDFIGHDGRLYRARWEIRRGRSTKARPGRLQDVKQSLRDVVNDAVLGDGNSEVRRLVEERLGLSFDELCRSVLLAQGGFQGFLQARPAERAELLEKVTGTGIYSRLGEAAFARAREVEQKLKALEAKLEGQPTFDEAARAAIEASLVIAASAAANADARGRALEHTLERRRAARAVQQALREVEAAHDVTARMAAAEAEARDARDAARARLDALAPLLLEHERAVAAAAPPRDRLAAAIDEVERREHSAGACREAWTRAAADADAERAVATAAEARVAQLGASIAGAIGASDTPPELLDDHLKDAIRALDDAADAAMQAIGARAVAAASERDVALAAAELDGAEAACADAHARADAALPPGVDVGEHAVAVGAVATWIGELADVELATLGTEITIREGLVARLEAALAEQMSRRALQVARAALRDDEPCPVCGSCTHPTRARHVEQPAGPHDERDPVDDVLRAEREALAARLDARATMRAILDAANRRARPVSPSPLARPASLGDARALLARLDDASEAVAAVAAADVARAHATAALDAARAAHAAQVSLRDQAEARLATARQTLGALRLVDSSDDAPLDGDVLRKRSRGLRDQREAWGAARSDAASAHAAVGRAEDVRAERARALADADAAVQSARAIASERQAAVDDADAAVALAAARLEARGVAGDGTAVARGLRDDLAAAETRLQAHGRAGREAEATLAAAKKLHAERRDHLDRLGGAPIDDDDNGDDGDTTLVEQIETVRAEAAAARDDAATARARLAHDDVVRAERLRLGEALAAARAEGEVWRALSQLIGSADGSRFRQFAQGLTLDALVAHANEHLAVLAPRYRLRRTRSEQQRHDLDLVVIDTEAGGDVRSTQTLSGGEGFLVSLALALGLSSLSANEGARGRVESLFIDEGFSALDQETLDVALSAFDALRQTGRQIGVISHVPLLMERLGAQVRVVPMGGGASRVEVHGA